MAGIIDAIEKAVTAFVGTKKSNTIDTIDTKESHQTIAKVTVISRSLQWNNFRVPTFDLQIIEVAHSGLLVESNTADFWIIEFMDDSNAHAYQVTLSSQPSSEDVYTTAVLQNEITGKWKRSSPQQTPGGSWTIEQARRRLQKIMGTYNLIFENCHEGREKLLEEILAGAAPTTKAPYADFNDELFKTKALKLAKSTGPKKPAAKRAKKEPTPEPLSESDEDENEDEQSSEWDGSDEDDD
eukprot:TRINITY_DN5231_c0_g1_i1.p1 TRINITY_DN5231_c0_g1~~TRINITY_DN5231_c0_g1_i1.p1  ORF type:complete len:252 (+),score=59.58 TRINITY_DN5231_c0_g1_i1:39-758(+)